MQLKQYISKDEWDGIKAPIYLKTILFKKFQLKFQDKPRNKNAINNNDNPLLDDNDIKLQIEEKKDNENNPIAIGEIMDLNMDQDDIGELPPGQAPQSIDNDRFGSFAGAVANQVPAAYAPSAPPKFSMSISENQVSDESKAIEEEMKYNNNNNNAILPSAPPKGSINIGGGSMEIRLLDDDDLKMEEVSDNPLVLRTDRDGDGRQIRLQSDPMELLDPRDTLQQVSDTIAQV